MPCRSALNTIYITSLGMFKECTAAGHAVALVNTNVCTGLGVREVCTEAVHAAALQTRTSPQGWACVKLYVPKQSMPCRSALNTI